MDVPNIPAHPRTYLIGSVYHFANQRWSINWVGPFETFLKARRDQRPTGVEVCNNPDTVIRAKRVVVSFEALLADRSDPFGLAELARLIDGPRGANAGDGNPAATGAPVRGSVAADVRLRLGAFLGDVTLCERALADRAHVNACGFAGMSAAHWAAACDHPEVLHFLLNRGADLHASNECSWDLLDLAGSNGAATICRMLPNLGFSKPGKAFADMLRRWGAAT